MTLIWSLNLVPNAQMLFPFHIMHIPSSSSPHRMIYGQRFGYRFGNTWPPSSSMHPFTLTHHPLKFNCGLSRHASRQPQQSTMASSGSFACPLALLNSQLGLNLHTTALEEKLTIDRFDIEDGPPLQLCFL